jgi:arginine:ornithine antiporter/lysine permease
MVWPAARPLVSGLENPILAPGARVTSLDSDTRAPADVRKFPLTTLIAMVVGSMVGAGIFSLPRNFALATGVYGALIAWVIAGTGMLMLAFVFQTLAVRKPELDAGVYAYAKAGFGEYLGFFSAWGYWASACIGNVTYWVLISSTLGLLWPGVFGHGDTVAAFVLGSAGLWIFYVLITRGVQEAAVVNKIVTVAKIVPIVTFIVVVIFGLKAHVFSANLWGGEAHSARALFGQVRGTMLTTVFVFLGIEGASVYSRYARRRQDVGRATVIGFAGVLALMVGVTVFSYGILSRAELQHLRQPSMAGVMEAVVGYWGTAFISVGVIVSVLGAYLAWTLMSAEVLFVAAKDKDMPSFLARTSGKNVPVPALIMTTVLIQLALVVTLFSEDAFTFTLKLCSALSLIPYLLAAAYALRLGASGETYDVRPQERGRQLFVAGLATFYTVFLVFAAGLDFLLLSFIIYAPGTVLFVMSRREQGRRAFSRAELVICVIAVAGALTGIICLAAGVITI